MRTKIPRIVFQAALIALFALPVSAGWPPVYTENFDNVRSPTLPSGWVASQGINVTGAPLWLTSLVSPSSAPNDAFSEAPDNILDNRLDTPVLPITGFSNAITFRHSYDLAGGLDGAVLEASSPDINGGAFTDITDPAVGGQFLGPGGYNTTISSAFQSPIAGRMAWSGNSGGYVTTTVGFPIPTFSGLKLRFRLVTDNSGASGGWRIDNLVVPRTEGSSPTPTPPPAPTPTPTPIPTPCGGPNVIADSTFEAGTPWPAWTVQTSTNFGTPLCDIAACGSSGPSQPYAGSNWAWFGGAAAAETATLGQSVSFPAGGQATLSFEMRIGAVSFQLTDVLNVRVDGTVVQSYPEPGNAEDAYSLRTIDVGAFADGAAHDILFEYIGPTTGSSIYAVDNVTLTDGVACPTPPPTVTPTATPSASPTATIFPTVTPTPSDCPGGGCTPTPSIPPPATATPSPSLTPTPTPPPTPTPTATPSPTPAQALNISTRLRVETGERIAIGGFIITGNASKTVALRGLGPSLGNSGLSDVLIDPILELRGSDGTLLLQNDNWQDDPFGGGGTALVALGLAPQNPNESGMVATLEPGSYTAFLSGKNQTSGLGLVEVYDVDTAADSQLANISTRGFVRTADDVMIGGFILGQGGGNTSVAVRGLGPSLGQVGLSNVLADPTLELHDGNGALLIANDNWQDDPVSAAQLTLHGLAPTNDLESGIFTTLPPGLFTAILAGKNGGIGLGLVEVYGGTSGTALNVTNTADSGAGSLRQTLADANDGDTIRFNTALNGQTITLTSAELVIDKSIAISGPGPKQLTVERSTATGIPEFRIFHVLPGQTVLIEGLEISGGRLPDAGTGGGVRNDQGTLTLNNCAVMSNIGGQFGGGVYNDGAKASLTLVNCTINYNYVGLPAGGSMGGGIYNNNGTVEITDSTINGNFATYVGGGIYNTSGGTLSIHGSVVDDNAVMVQFSNPPQFVGSCGGIFNAGTAEVSNCAISHNTGGTEGGGIDNQGSLSIADSTIDHNTVIGVGGGIYSRGPLTIGNSTISGNTANFKGLGNGGGIDSESASLAITNSTFSGNTVADPFGQGGGIFIAGGTLQLQNTILNASGMGGSIHNESGTVTSNGYNLSSDDGGGFLIGVGDQINTDPILGPLQDNDGPTFTHALLSGSPAINAGDPSFASPPLYDQRGPGYDRVAGGRIDIGSFEVPAGLALRFRH